MICIWGAEDEELRCICCSLPAGDGGSKHLTQTSVGDSWMVAHLGKMHMSFIFLYKSVAVSFMLTLQFLC